MKGTHAHRSAISRHRGANWAASAVLTAFATLLMLTFGSVREVSAQPPPGGASWGLDCPAGDRFINDKYQSLGDSGGFLGLLHSGGGPTPDGVGCFRHYDGGSIYWSPQTGAHEVQGGIRDKWASLGWERSFLGYPTTDETGTPDGHGRYNHFQGGSVYWTLQTGAHEVHGAIRDKWASLGWERSFLGYPTTDETGTPDGSGRFNHFQHGSIYWTQQPPAPGAHEVQGGIRDKWASLGWERSFLGYPTTDETAVPDGVGRYNDFQKASIYWSPQTGAWEVDLPIRDKWASRGQWADFGSEISNLGYPTTDTTKGAAGELYNGFERGSIYSIPGEPDIDIHVVKYHDLPQGLTMNLHYTGYSSGPFAHNIPCETGPFASSYGDVIARFDGDVGQAGGYGFCHNELVYALIADQSRSARFKLLPGAACGFHQTHNSPGLTCMGFDPALNQCPPGWLPRSQFDMSSGDGQAPCGNLQNQKHCHYFVWCEYQDPNHLCGDPHTMKCISDAQETPYAVSISSNVNKEASGAAVANGGNCPIGWNRTPSFDMGRSDGQGLSWCQ
jgi:LGFP repeat